MKRQHVTEYTCPEPDCGKKFYRCFVRSERPLCPACQKRNRTRRAREQRAQGVRLLSDKTLARHEQYLELQEYFKVPYKQRHGSGVHENEKENNDA